MKRWLLLGLTLWFCGCVQMSLRETDKGREGYISSVELQKRGWQHIGTEGQQVFFSADGHRIVLELGTNYASIDGRTINLKQPIYTLEGVVFVPKVLLEKLTFFPSKTPTPQERQAPSPVFRSPTSSLPPSSPSREKSSEEEDFLPPPSDESIEKPLERVKVSLSHISLPKNPNWRYIVIHHSSTKKGCARTFDIYHRRYRHWKNGLGYHFVIGNGSQSGDGQIEIGPRWKRQIAGAHAGSRKYNRQGIGICLVGDFQKSSPSPRQMAALVALTKRLMRRYRIPLSRVLPHRKVRPAPTDCPGKRFPWRQFLQALRR